MSDSPRPAILASRDAVSRSPGDVLWPATAVLLLALAVRLAAVSEASARYDEFYHVLAARSWLQDGTFRVLDGEYLRTQGFTVLVGWSFKIFGVSIAAGRLPSVIAGAALVAAVFVWMHSQAGRTAAWVSALLLCFASVAVDLSAFVRFYMPHALLIWLGSVIVYDATAGPERRMSYWMLLPAGLLFAAAWYLQITTMIGILALTAWALADATRRLPSRRLIEDRRVWALAAIAAIAGLAALSLGLLGKIEEFYRAFRHVELWNIEHRDEITFYYSRFRVIMPLLWNLFPAAAVIAIASRPRPALFCILLTAIPLVIHSFAGMKEIRYVAYVLPFFFAVWGIAIGAIGPPFLSWTREASGKLFGEGGGSPVTGERVRRVGSIAVVIVVAAAAAAGNPIFKGTAGTLARSAVALTIDPSRLLADPPDGPWADHGDELRRRVESASVVLATDSVGTAYHAGDFDLQIHRANIDAVSGEGSPPREFILDPRTGRPVIGAASSVRQVMQCYPDGIVLIPVGRWRKPLLVTDEVADLLEASARLTRFPGRSPDAELLVFEWKHGRPVDRADCDEILRIVTEAHQPDPSHGRASAVN